MPLNKREIVSSKAVSPAPPSPHWHEDLFGGHFSFSIDPAIQMTFKRVIRFTNDTYGLEKILRLLQSFAQILAEYTSDFEAADNWYFIRRQFALGRRYFRFFRFLDFFSKAYTAFHEERGLRCLLSVGKWSCLGAYLFLESCTILDVMGIWESDWADSCMHEANRLWFTSLVFSIILGSMKLLGLLAEHPDKDSWARKYYQSPVDVKKMEAHKSKTVEEPSVLKRRLATDCFDLFIPGHFVGWIRTSPAFVGFASVMSTTLSSRDVWDRIK